MNGCKVQSQIEQITIVQSGGDKGMHYSGEVQAGKKLSQPTRMTKNEKNNGFGYHLAMIGNLTRLLG